MRKLEPDEKDVPAGTIGHPAAPVSYDTRGTCGRMDNVYDESKDKGVTDSCPDCDTGMVRLGSCFSCPSCGYQVCGG